MRKIFVVSNVMIAAFLGLLSAAHPSRAQQSGQPADASRDEALSEVSRKLFTEGIKALEQKQWERCRAAFLAAWNIKKHYQNAGNLAECEAKLGLYRDAAEHLRYFLREIPKDSPPERKRRGQALFEEVRAKVATVAISVNLDGADVLVDGAPVGRSPLPESVFIEPGLRRMEARATGYPSVQKVVEINLGSLQEVSLELKGPEKPAASMTPVGQVPASSHRSLSASSDQPRSSANSMSPPVRKIVIGTGIATTAVLVGTGVAFAVVSSRKNGEADSLLESLEDEHGPAPCQIIGQDAAECTKLRSLRADYDRYFDASVWTFVAGGVTGVATVAYMLITRKRTETTTVQAVPMVGAGRMGIGLRGQW